MGPGEFLAVFINGYWKVQRVQDDLYVDLPPIEPSGQGFYHIVEQEGEVYAWQGGEITAVNVRELFSTKEAEKELEDLECSEEDEEIEAVPEETGLTQMTFHWCVRLSRLPSFRFAGRILV